MTLKENITKISYERRTYESEDDKNENGSRD